MTDNWKAGCSFIFLQGENGYINGFQGKIRKSEMWFRTAGVLRLFRLSDVHQVMQEVGPHCWNLEVSFEPGVVSCYQNVAPMILQV